MIRFVDKNGYTFNGEPPYVHWFEGAQSVGLQYSKTIWVISDLNSLTFSIDENNGVFCLIDPNDLRSTTPPIILNDIKKYNLTLSGELSNSLYLYQLIVVGSSAEPCQCQETIHITGTESLDIIIGADFYELDEILQINLENRGTEIPENIQKAIYDNNIEEEFTDSILINRKFKELISNYLDIMNNRGSYLSLYNSLKWFEWGDKAKLYEVWQDDSGYFEKELENILSEQFEYLLFTHRKTSYLSIIAPLHESTDSLDDEKNPVVIPVPQDWPMDQILLKVSLLGAFYERYFLPIHLSLLRASAQALVYTTQIKVLNGSACHPYNWHDDTGVVDLKFDDTVVLGNIQTVSADRDTMFAYRSGYNGIDSFTDYESIMSMGVNPLQDISSQSSATADELMTIWANLHGGVGVVTPITVTVPLPADDALTTETLVLYRYPLDETPQSPGNEIIERKQIKSRNIGPDSEHPIYAAQFVFNILSTHEEKVSFSLQLHSASGHTWTAAGTYNVIDTRGSKLHVCRVKNKVFDKIFVSSNSSETAWATWNPYEGMFNTIELDSNNPDELVSYIKYSQFLPTAAGKYLNELVVVKVSTLSELNDNIYINNNYYTLERGDTSTNKYIVCIGKQGGVICEDSNKFKTNANINNDIIRFDHIFIPQLHEYVDIEDLPIRRDARTNKPVMTKYDYIIDPTKDLLCVRPEFKYSNLITGVIWAFTNLTTGEKIEYNSPVTQNQPLILDNKNSIMSPGYWGVEVRYKFSGSDKINKLSKKSAFLIKKQKDDQ